MTMLQHGLVPSTGGYQIERSLRFNNADSTYLGRTPGSAGNRRKWTFSVWLKRTTLGDRKIFVGGTGTTDSTFLNFFFDSAHKLKVSGYNTDFLETTQVFRDVSAWYHLVLVADTDNSTSSDRLQLYVNGSRITAFGVASYPTGDLGVNNTQEHNIGRSSFVSGYFDGYMADVHFIDGSALTPSSFGENDTDTGVWKPKAYTGSYGTNGFKLTFSDNSGTTSTTLGKDTSGNGNNWTPNNFSVTAGAGNDSLVDTPTPYGTDTGAGGQVRGNYCTWNPLNKGSTYTLANGNLDSSSSTSAYAIALATFGMTTGKWYWEHTVINKAVGSDIEFGICKEGLTLTQYLGQGPLAWAYATDGKTYNNNVGSTYGSSYTNNDVISVAFDADAGKLWFAKNGTWQASGSPTGGTNAAFTGLTSGPYFPAADIYNTNSHVTNFGQRPFAYTAPSGFKALCTTNLPTPTIGATSSTRADDYFNTVLYTGNGSTQSITGVGFQPDFLWIKGRNAVTDHALTDAVRGVTKYLFSNLTNAESTASTVVTSFDSDGFSLSTSSTVNGNSNTYVGWNWKANGAGSSNTAGSITSTVSANTTAGFSIVTYTGNNTSGATVGHGLGVKPAMIICKRRENIAAGQSYWQMYHTSLGATKVIWLNLTDGAYTSSSPWNNTEPTSTVFTLGSDPPGNPNGDDVVAYCFAPVAGYSAFGSYTGNGSADGPFVYTGFRPKFVLMKANASGYYWVIEDSVRDAYNPANKKLFPNVSDAEDSTTENLVDFLSNGFKCRTANSRTNDSGVSYIYAAFAESPFKYSLAR